jgi:hypothetical protein
VHVAACRKAAIPLAHVSSEIFPGFRWPFPSPHSADTAAMRGDQRRGREAMTVEDAAGAGRRHRSRQHGHRRSALITILLIYCSDYKCSHLATISGDRWPDDMRLSDLEPRFICTACGKRGADVRPDFSWNKKPVVTMGYR